MNNEELYHHGILGQRWGVRRYQNEDGTYTKAGEARRKKEETKNNRRKNKDRLTKEGVDDVERWVTDDITNQKKAVDTTSKIVSDLQRMERESSPKPTKERMDLSNMTDKELRDRINRELTERQYNDLFGKTKSPTISKGREYMRNSLEVAGSVLTIGSSALGIALAIRELKGK